MMTTQSRSRSALSLRERILRAKTADEISALLAEGGRFHKASGRTRRQWEAVAQQRREEVLHACMR